MGRSISILNKARAEVSRQYGRHGQFSRSFDRLNRLPLLRDFILQSPPVPRFLTREAMWDHLAVPSDSPIDYLEFGVHEGHSILHWANVNAHADSRFVGFDTFEGLPEEWNWAYPKGYFDTKGRVPQTNDQRVSFIKGLFQDKLGSFLTNYELRECRRVIHIDCDLYSSALFCLTKLDAILTSGTIVIFDEFGDVQHEFRAFKDYTASYRRSARLIAAHDDFFTAAVAIV